MAGTAMDLGTRAADEVIRAHLNTHGDPANKGET
jgi:hypothetical protein